MVDKCQDPRVIRTQQLLLEALMSLAETKPFSKLSVTEITERAGLDRSTFYLHYGGIHALLEDLAAHLFDELRETIYGDAQPGFRQAPEDVEKYVVMVFTHLKQHQKFYKSMLGKQGDPYFKELFQGLLSELLFEPIAGASAERAHNSAAELTLRFYTAGFSGIAAWWLDRDMPISSQKAAHLIARDILPGYLALMG